jgi:release factor glutamine methyltransferase
VRVVDAVAEATTALTEARVGSPRVDAELLAAFVLGVPRGRLLTAEFSADQVDRFRGLVRQRAARVPLQYLTGSAPFRLLELAVGEGVFVPRPETETVVGWGLEWLSAQPARPGVTPLVVDLCSGSGAIAAAVATEWAGRGASFPRGGNIAGRLAGLRVVAVEQDPGALVWLRRNVDRLALTGAVQIVEGDATQPATLSELDGQVDLVLTNPPYVPEIGAAGLPAEVSLHDPHRAVFGGIDGLDVIRPLIGRIAGLLRPGGAFAMEHDDTHAYVVPTLVDADGRFSQVELHHDLARRARFTTATARPGPARMADLRP